MSIVLFLASAAMTGAADQASKQMVVRRLVENHWRPVVGSWGFRRRFNPTGSLVGLSYRIAAALFVVAAIVALAAVALVPELSGPPAAGLGLVVGGAASNLFDRRVRGAVVDFVELGRWPTFNVADAAMVAGTAALAWSVM